MAVTTLGEIYPSSNWFPAVSWPHESLIDSHQDGCTEPYIAEAVCALLKTLYRSPTVLELGGFMGTTTAWLALTLEKIGGGHLTVSEPDVDRNSSITSRIRGLAADGALTRVPVNVSHIPSPAIIFTFDDKSIDFVWVDDDHSRLHVEQEINALWPKMKPGGLMLFHDVSSDGVCQLGPLIRKYGGIALDLPRLGPDGGLGIIQIPNV